MLMARRSGLVDEGCAQTKASVIRDGRDSVKAKRFDSQTGKPQPALMS
jgi:hypothetical protein